MSASLASASAAPVPSRRPPVEYAGFWLRAIAAAIDLVLLGIPTSVFVSFLAVGKEIPLAFLQLRPGETPNEVIAAFGKPSLYVVLFFFIASSGFYFALLESSPWQGTIGKKVFGLYVADLEGKQAGLGHTAARFCGGRLLMHVPVCGVIYFVVDCVCAGFTPRKQAIHDCIAGCVVLRKRAGILFRE